jgi:hypothetical protein
MSAAETAQLAHKEIDLIGGLSLSLANSDASDEVHRATAVILVGETDASFAPPQMMPRVSVATLMIARSDGVCVASGPEVNV